MIKVGEHITLDIIGTTKEYDPSVDASHIPFSVIKPVTYFAGVTSNAKFIDLLFFG